MNWVNLKISNNLREIFRPRIAFEDFNLLAFFIMILVSNNYGVDFYSFVFFWELLGIPMIFDIAVFPLNKNKLSPKIRIWD